MARSSDPFVSVVVLNYNGLRFLERCLGSLLQLDYPSDRYEVVVVDNASSDGSAEIAERGFPGVRVIRNNRNLGFAGGNNVAMRTAHAEYIALLNNDTWVTRQWLARLVEAAEHDHRIGACTSKLIFLHDRIRLRLETTPFRPSEWGLPDRRELGVRILDARVIQGEASREAEYLDGFYGVEPSVEGPFRWSAAVATIGLPVLRDGGEVGLQLVAAAPRPNDAGTRLTIRAAGHVFGTWELGSRPCLIEVPVPSWLVQQAVPVIQNAGTLILRNGAGRDRGTFVVGSEAYQEDDLGQYNRIEEVFAGCGAALLLRKAMLDDVGLFDEDFFMYYEDMDLSWRARRRGWKIVYVPEATVRHAHAASSVEWSPLFLYHVERNRLLMLAKNAPAALALREHLRYVGEVSLNLARCARSSLLRPSDRAVLAGRVAIQLRVIASLLCQLPRTLAKRQQLGKRELVPASKLLRWMVAA